MACGYGTATLDSLEYKFPIRNERVISSNLISGSPLCEELYLLKLTYLGLLAKVTEGSFKNRTRERLEAGITATVAVTYLLWQESIMPKFSTVVRPYKCSARPNVKSVLNVWYPTGKRQRRYFETKEAALAEQAVKRVEVENLGLRGLELSDRLRLEACISRYGANQRCDLKPSRGMAAQSGRWSSHDQHLPQPASFAVRVWCAQKALPGKSCRRGRADDGEGGRG